MSFNSNIISNWMICSAIAIIYQLFSFTGKFTHSFLQHKPYATLDSNLEQLCWVCKSQHIESKNSKNGENFLKDTPQQWRYIFLASLLHFEFIVKGRKMILYK